MPATSATSDQFANVLTAVESALTSLGILAGGLWAYYTYFRGRTFRSRLEPAVGGRVSVSGDLLFLVATVELKNVGLGKVPIQQRGTALRVYGGHARGGEGETVCIEWERLDTLSVFEKHAWVEPGETIRDTAALAARSPDLAAFKLEFRIVSEKLEWMTTAIVDTLEHPESRRTEEGLHGDADPAGGTAARRQGRHQGDRAGEEQRGSSVQRTRTTRTRSNGRRPRGRSAHRGPE